MSSRIRKQEVRGSPDLRVKALMKLELYARLISILSCDTAGAIINESGIVETTTVPFSAFNTDLRFAWIMDSSKGGKTPL